MTDENDTRPLDDRLPDQPAPEEESPFDIAQREAQERLGVVERDGALIDAERDWFTVSGLKARMAEVLEHLATANRDRVTAERDAFELSAAYQTTYEAAKQIEAAYEQLLAFYQNLERGIKASMAAWRTAIAERDAAQAELVELRRIVHETKKRPLVTAALLVASKLFSRKEPIRDQANTR